MSENTNIEWCDATFNSIIGCAPCSTGCQHCYAKTLTERFGKDFAVRRRTTAANWKKAETWNRKALESYSPGDRNPRVFCASMADWLDDADVLMPDGRIDQGGVETLADLLDLIRRTPNLDWLLLSKRPENWMGRIADARDSLLQRGNAAGGFWCQAWWASGQQNDGPLVAKPPANVWMGVSAENQEYWDKRVPVLLDIPARVRFVSCEPLLGPIDMAYAAFNGADSFGSLEGIHWTIWGGESGPKARPCNVEWIRDGVRQCREAGVAAFVKQLGARPYNGGRDDMYDECVGTAIHYRNRKGGDMAEWPEDLRIREWPEGGER